jgi:hypothetical protein
MSSSDQIKHALARLGDRSWPESWGRREREEIGDYYGWSHRYQLNRCLAETEILAFESHQRVSLPEDYRNFILQIGNGGAGPFYGIYPLGQDGDRPMRESVLDNLHKWFLHQDSWDAPSDEEHTVFEHPDFDEAHYFSDDVMQGAMPICTQGCATDYWLVVSGPVKGTIWLDDRANGNGIEPMEDDDGDLVKFGAWYLEWLQDAESKWVPD